MLRVNIHLVNCSSFMMGAIANPNLTKNVSHHWFQKSLLCFLTLEDTSICVFVGIWKEEIVLGILFNQHRQIDPWVKHKRLISTEKKWRPPYTGHQHVPGNSKPKNFRSEGRKILKIVKISYEILLKPCAF